MIKCLTINILFVAGHIVVHRYVSFRVVATMSREPRPVYEGMYMVEGHDEILFLTLDDPIVSGLDHHHLRCFAISPSDMCIPPFYYFLLLLD
jgi:hypothetical protein